MNTKTITKENIDNAKTTIKETCNNTIQVGIKKCSLYTTKQIIILGLLAGAFTALGGFASSMAAHAIGNYSISSFVCGSVFSIGLILVLTCGGELFTGNVLTIQAYLQKKITAKQFFKNLILVYIFNAIGVFIVCALIYFSGLLTSNNGQLLAYIIKATQNKVSLGFGPALTRGLLCNFLVCLGVWGAYGTKNSTTKVILGYLAITGFIVSGFQNSIANMYYFSITLLSSFDHSLMTLAGSTGTLIHDVSVSSMVGNLIPVTIGNIVGGILFVGIAYWVTYEYIPRQSQARLVVITPSNFNTNSEAIFDKEDFFIVDIENHSTVFIADNKKEGIIDLRYVDFESNYYCH